MDITYKIFSHLIKENIINLKHYYTISLSPYTITLQGDMSSAKLVTISAFLPDITLSPDSAGHLCGNCRFVLDEDHQTTIQINLT